MKIESQPDDSTCGPTCLHAVLRHFGEAVSLDEIIRETPELQQGGTLAVLLGIQAIRRGYQATIYSFDLKVLDPSWFGATSSDDARERHAHLLPSEIIERLRQQAEFKSGDSLAVASEGYIEFLELGGILKMEDLTPQLLRGYLERSLPLLTGLSATYLYRQAREFGPNLDEDDIRGIATGQFVVIHEYDRQDQTISIADPFLPNPLGQKHHYKVDFDHLVCSILLGVLTFDANLLVIEPNPNSIAIRNTNGNRNPEHN